MLGDIVDAGAGPGAGARASSCSSACTASAAGIAGSPTRSGAATATRRWRRSAARRTRSTWLPSRRGRDRGRPGAGPRAGGRGGTRRWSAPLATARRRRRSRRSGGSGCCAPTGAVPTASATGRSRVQAWLAAGHRGRLEQRDYVGRPLLVTENDYELGLYNGDTGVIVAGRRRASRGRVRARRRGAALQPAAARRGRDRVRDDDPQEPGLAVRHRGRAAAGADLADPDPGAALHGASRARAAS